jgi:hypothetical protein
MDAVHIMVAVLTAAALALAVWAEIRSRRRMRMLGLQSPQEGDSESQRSEHLQSKRAS